MDAIQPNQPGPVGASRGMALSPTVRPTVAGPESARSNPTLGSAGRAGNIGSSVQALLREIGGGAQNNEALQMLITLMIFMALLQAAQGGGSSTSGNPLDALSSLAQSGTTGTEGSAALHYEQTSISITSTTIVAVFDPATTANEGGTLDLHG